MRRGDAGGCCADGRSRRDAEPEGPGRVREWSGGARGPSGAGRRPTARHRGACGCGNLGHDGTILWTAAEERLSVDAGCGRSGRSSGRLARFDG
jgi:hypothetical protein